MDSTRNTGSMFPQSVVLGAVALSIALLSWAIVRQTGILPLALTSASDSRPMLAERQDSTANAEGLAIYSESERRPFATSFSKEAGLATFHESERGTAVVPVSSEAGLAIYRQSERGNLSNAGFASNQEGLAIYRDSERNQAHAAPALTGWDIYRASEQGR